VHALRFLLEDLVGEPGEQVEQDRRHAEADDDDRAELRSARFFLLATRGRHCSDAKFFLLAIRGRHRCRHTHPPYQGDGGYASRRPQVVTEVTSAAMTGRSTNAMARYWAYFARSAATARACSASSEVIRRALARSITKPSCDQSSS